jgi:hypothetical protein
VVLSESRFYEGVHHKENVYGNITALAVAALGTALFAAVPA